MIPQKQPAKTNNCKRTAAVADKCGSTDLEWTNEWIKLIKTGGVFSFFRLLGGEHLQHRIEIPVGVAEETDQTQENVIIFDQNGNRSASERFEIDQGETAQDDRSAKQREEK